MQQDTIRHIKDLQAQKDRLLEFEQQQSVDKKRVEQQIKDWPHPYANEIDTCAHLVGYCQMLRRKAGLEVDGELAAKEA